MSTGWDMKDLGIFKDWWVIFKEGLAQNYVFKKDEYLVSRIYKELLQFVLVNILERNWTHTYICIKHTRGGLL